MSLCDDCVYKGVLSNEYPCNKCEDFGHFVYKDKKETVDHPDHYNRVGGMECIDEMITIFGIEETMSFCKLNAWKYRYRAADKGAEEDLKKSDWYIAKYAELKERNENNGN